MSNPIRIGAVVEGTTDLIVLDAAMTALLDEQSFELVQLQPEASLAFGTLVFGATGTGWPGVYAWCQDAVDKGGGTVRGHPLFDNYDVLLIHIDADVAKKTYASGNIVDAVNDLPCAAAGNTITQNVDALRAVLLRWLAEVAMPPKTVFATPVAAIEAWVLVALYPQDHRVLSKTVEAMVNPERYLQAKPADGRLVRGGKKQTEVYRRRAQEITSNWDAVCDGCTEAERFSIEFTSALL